MNLRHRIAIVLATALALGGLSVAPTPSLAFDDHVFTVTTDYSTSGSSTVMEVTAPWSTDVGVEPVCNDPVVRHFLGHHFVVNRIGCDNIQVIDPETRSTVAEYSVGVGSNPQDIMVVSETSAYVSRFNSRWLLEVDPFTGTWLDSVDLGGFSDADGLPEMVMMALDGDHLLIQIQRLDQDGFFDPQPPSWLAVVNVTTNQLVDVNPGQAGTQGVLLTGLNPKDKMVHDREGRRLYVTEIGNYGVLDGGVDVIDLDALSPLGFETTEAQLGGDITCGVPVSDTRGFILVSDDFFFTTTLRTYDRQTGASGAAVYSGEFIPCIFHDAPTDQLFLVDRTVARPGIRVYDAVTNAPLSSGAISTGLPPVDLVVARAEPVDVAGDVAAPGPVVRGRATPNPFRVTTRLTIPAGMSVRLAAIYDVRGRLVRTLDSGTRLPGPRVALDWDGRDEAGTSVSPGVYIYRIQAAERGLSGQIVRIR